MIFVVLFNQSLGIPLAYLSYATWRSMGGPADMRFVPETKDVFLRVFLAMVGHDFFFYHSHRWEQNQIDGGKCLLDQDNLSST